MSIFRSVRKKPVVVHAVRWDGTQNHAFEILKNMEARSGSCYKFPSLIENECCHLVINTLEGAMFASPGDWIIKGVNGEYYPVKDEIFRKTYEMDQSGNE